MKKTGLSPALLSATLFLAATCAAMAEPPAPALKANQTALLQRYDLNHDGKLDEAELAAAHEGMLKAGAEPGGGRRSRLRAALLRKFDRNGDGRLDATERAEARGYFLQRFDTNHDGRLDEEERAAMRAKLKAEHQAGR